MKKISIRLIEFIQKEWNRKYNTLLFNQMEQRITTVQQNWLLLLITMRGGLDHSKIKNV